MNPLFRVDQRILFSFLPSVTSCCHIIFTLKSLFHIFSYYFPATSSSTSAKTVWIIKWNNIVRDKKTLVLHPLLIFWNNWMKLILLMLLSLLFSSLHFEISGKTKEPKEKESKSYFSLKLLNHFYTLRLWCYFLLTSSSSSSSWCSSPLIFPPLNSDITTELYMIQIVEREKREEEDKNERT